MVSKMFGRFIYDLRNKKQMAVIISGQNICFIPMDKEREIYFSLQSQSITVDNDKMWYRIGKDIQTYSFYPIDMNVYDSLLCGLRSCGGSFACITKRIVKEVFFYSHGI